MTPIIDTNNDVTAHLAALEADGISCVIRYISTYTAGEKCVKPAEARAIAAAGLKLGLVFEVWGGSDNFTHGDINAASGARDGAFAADWAARVGAPAGTIIWLAVDNDASPAQIDKLIIPYFRAAKAALAPRWRAGIYGCGAACAAALDAGAADAAWLSNAMGWSGSRAFAASRRWRLLQHPEATLHGLSVDYDEAAGNDYGAFVPFLDGASVADARERADADAGAGAPATAETAAPAGILDPAKRAAILDLAASSRLARVEWRDRGRAPIGYVKGMALAFAHVLAALAAGDELAVAMARAATGDDSRDALAWYGSRLAAAGMDVSRDGPDTLRHLFVLLTGLGMRESSGKFCEGRDRSADNTSAESAEAGLFQMSFDARSGCPQIASLLTRYRAGSDDPEGLGPVFHEGVTCSVADLACYGAGNGADFQRITKASPTYAVICAGIGLRTIGGRRGHWGPIRRQEAELRPEADELFRAVAQVVGRADGR
jgi:hypothetical protein